MNNKLDESLKNERGRIPWLSTRCKNALKNLFAISIVVRTEVKKSLISVLGRSESDAVWAVYMPTDAVSEPWVIFSESRFSGH